MNRNGKRWILPSPGEGQVAALARELQVAPAVARALVHRGVADAEQARAFFNPSPEQLASPWLMQGMDCAVERILLALDKGERVALYGDYDADGITATALLVEVLRALGGDPLFELPSRFAEGYGLHAAALEKLRGAGCTLAVTVDCGITAASEAEYARAIGLDLIITDHHRPREALPRACAVLNPLQEGCCYPFKELAGVGIAYRLAAALREKCGGRTAEEWLDLAALGTVADVVPLTGENRVLAALGLERINRHARPGLKALAEASGLQVAMINSGHLAYILAPALNAAGRMGDPLPAVHLLLEREEAAARPLAASLRQENQRRRAVEQQIFSEAEAALALDPGTSDGRHILVAAGEGWHPGVIGIVASRLVEKYYRPVVLISLEGEEGRGSARSIPGFDITAALSATSGLLERFGGHTGAAGLTVAAGRVAELAAALEAYAARALKEVDLVPSLFLDGEMEEHEITLETARQLNLLQPFGTGNPEPVFCSRGWDLLSWRQVGAAKSHLKFSLDRGGRALNPIFFSAAERAASLQRGRALDLALALREGIYRDQPVLEVELKEIAFGDSSGSGRVTVIDRRGKGAGISYIRELLRRSGAPVAVFSGTAARRAQLAQGLDGYGPVHFLTSGGNGGESGGGGAGMTGGGAGETAPRDLVLHDLPVHFSAVAPFFSAAPPGGELRVHLLFDTRGLRLNAGLLAAALPEEAALEEACRAVRESAAGDGSGTAAGLTPAAFFALLPPGVGESYRRRSLEIFLEAGILEQVPGGSLKVRGNKTGENSYAASPAYREACSLREQCRLFQEALLEEGGEAVAALLERGARGEY